MKELHSQGSWFFRHVTSPLDNCKNQLKTSVKEIIAGKFSDFDAAYKSNMEEPTNFEGPCINPPNIRVETYAEFEKRTFEENSVDT